MKKIGLIVLIAIVGITLNWLALLAGWWWITGITGLLVGLVLTPGSIGFLISLCAGALSWGLPLLVLAQNAPVTTTARAVESVVGLFSTGGTALLILTVVLGCILSVAGTWVGVAGRQVFRGWRATLGVSGKHA